MPRNKNSAPGNPEATDDKIDHALVWSLLVVALVLAGSYLFNQANVQNQPPQPLPAETHIYPSGAEKTSSAAATAAVNQHTNTAH